jgi:hypothetical protein
MATTPKLRKLLSEIEPELIRAFPLAAKAANISEPVYALILCYIDTTTNDYTPYVEVAPERVRRWAIERKGEEASWLIWRPRQELGGEGNLPKQQYVQGASLKTKIQACYKLLTAASNDDDDVQLRPFREMMWRVARTLNDRAWSGILNTTDDFVVVASDWSSFWTKEDATNSLPPNKLRLLQTRRLFYHERTDEELADFQGQLSELEAKHSTETEGEQIAFWIDQVTQLAAGKPCLFREKGWSVSVAFERLKAIGLAASMPLLDLAVKVGAMPQQANGQRSAASVALEAVFSTVADIGCANPVIEKRLRTLLDAACKANQKRETWSRTPFLCAYCLARLFDYPWPSTDHANVLSDVDKYLSAPLRANQQQ